MLMKLPATLGLSLESFAACALQKDQKWKQFHRLGVPLTGSGNIRAVGSKIHERDRLVESERKVAPTHE